MSIIQGLPCALNTMAFLSLFTAVGLGLGGRIAGCQFPEEVFPLHFNSLDEKLFSSGIILFLASIAALTGALLAKKINSVVPKLNLCMWGKQ